MKTAWLSGTRLPRASVVENKLSGGSAVDYSISFCFLFSIITYLSQARCQRGGKMKLSAPLSQAEIKSAQIYINTHSHKHTVHI